MEGIVPDALGLRSKPLERASGRLRAFLKASPSYWPKKVRPSCESREKNKPKHLSRVVLVDVNRSISMRYGHRPFHFSLFRMIAATSVESFCGMMSNVFAASPENYAHNLCLRWMFAEDIYSCEFKVWYL
ncbi:hypothetical protein CEXT_113261 [Caerostris extrusa]|uniref:Uncharacterized protein n=1 Tax=Caerostris extrusa TaxID=172846 RepID=A0AAV4X707_CAEEX|nr:hypothetical protein CEXT_113261 [Caerostris extrusa]